MGKGIAASRTTTDCAKKSESPCSDESLYWCVGLGHTLRRKISLTDSCGVPINLTGMTFQGHIRVNANDTGVPVASFTITIDGPPEAGKILVVLPASVSAALSVQDYAFDIRRINGLEIDPIVGGILTIGQTVTR